jgi:hypothetical protein
VNTQSAGRENRDRPTTRAGAGRSVLRVLPIADMICGGAVLKGLLVLDANILGRIEKIILDPS